MKDERLLTPETFCDIAEAVEHAEALLKLLHRLNCKPRREVRPLGLRGLTDLLRSDIDRLHVMLYEDIKASKELP